MSLQLPEAEGFDFQPKWKAVGGILALVAVVIIATAAVTWSLAKDAYANDEMPSLGDLIQKLDKNRLGIVVGTTKEETCVVLLDDSFGPMEPVVCTDNDAILNYTDYDYGPSVLPALGDKYEIRYFVDRGVQEGLVFFPIGSAPKPKTVPTPGVDVGTPTATPEK